MAVTYGFFNSVNGDRKYNADQMSEYFEGIINEGVCQHIGGGLAVTAGTGLSVVVATGKAFIGQKWLKNDAALTLTISAASESYSRIDAVVIRKNNAVRSCQIAVKVGTPAASPVAPTMTRDSTTYEMALAYVTVAAGASSVTVTDKRADSAVCGWAAVAQATSGEVDQMLNDMKTGFDGVEYDSPVEAVWGQVSELSDRITNNYNASLVHDGYVEIIPISYEIAPYSSGDTADIKPDTGCKSFVFYANKNTDYIIKLSGSFNRFSVYGNTKPVPFTGQVNFMNSHRIATSADRTSGATVIINSGEYNIIIVYAVASNVGFSPLCNIVECNKSYTYDSTYTLPSDIFKNGNYEPSGITTGGTNRIRCDYVKVKKGDALKIKANGQKYVIVLYSGNNGKMQLIGSYDWVTMDQTYVFNGTVLYGATGQNEYTEGFMSILVANTDNSDLGPDDLILEATIISKTNGGTYNERIESKKQNVIEIGSPEIYMSESTGTGSESVDSKTLSELYAIYDELVSNYPTIIQRGEDLGSDSSNNSIRQYIVKFDGPWALTGEVTLSGLIPVGTTNEWLARNDNKIVLVNTGCHGNEKAPTWGTALAIKELVESTEPWAMYIKNNYIIKILPCMNPYGFEHTTRRNGNNVDLNRDCADFTQGETIAWKKFIDDNSSNSIVYLDTHGTSGYYAYFESLTDLFDRHYNDYLKAYLKFVSAINENWLDYWDFQVDVKPSCLFINSTYTGMTMNYTNWKGIPGHILETPQDAENGGTGSWTNRIKSCKITKDMLLNCIQIYGHYFNK